MKKLLFEILVLSVVSFGLLWLLDSTADAQCPGGKCPTERTQPQSPGWRWAPNVPLMPTIRVHDPAIVRIRVTEDVGISSLGSGVVFRQERKIAYVLTAAHVVSNRRKDSKSVIVYVNRVAYYATVLACNETWDVAILRISDPKVKPIALSDRVPKLGDSVQCSGFGPDGIYKYATGQMTQYVSPGKEYPFEWMEVRTTVRNGDSGGPIVNTAGCIVGLITGCKSGVTVGPCLPRIRRIVDGLLGCKPPPRQAPPSVPAKPGPLGSCEPLPAVIDYDKLAAAVLKQINPDDFRGPAGPAGMIGAVGQTGLSGARGDLGPAGPQGPSGSYSDLTEEEMLDLANRIKKLINGSVRVKVEAVQ